MNTCILNYYHLFKFISVKYENVLDVVNQNLNGEANFG